VQLFVNSYGKRRKPGGQGERDGGETAAKEKTFGCRRGKVEVI